MSLFLFSSLPSLTLCYTLQPPCSNWGPHILVASLGSSLELQRLRSTMQNLHIQEIFATQMAFSNRSII
jgi:hypothetical protein